MPNFTPPRKPVLLNIEEAIKKETGWVVFEPNNQTTWIRVRTTIENYLTQQWRAGTLMGTRPAEAFYVHVGLGQTMTQLDILEGRLIIIVGVATIRPAEFVLLQFTYKTAAS